MLLSFFSFSCDAFTIAMKYLFLCLQLSLHDFNIQLLTEIFHWSALMQTFTFFLVKLCFFYVPLDISAFIQVDG